MKTKRIYTTLILLSFLAIGIQPVLATYSIPSNKSFGDWDSINKIYTLKANVNDIIEIDSDYITTWGNSLTFDGNWKTVTITGNSGIRFTQSLDITIKNLNVTGSGTGINVQNATSVVLIDNDTSNNSDAGILLDHSNNITITNNNALSNYRGICLQSCTGNIALAGNTISDNTGYGIRLYNCGSTGTVKTVSDNLIKDNVGSAHAISLQGSSYFTIKNNTISNNAGGIRILGYSGDNDIYNNNFIGNTNTIFLASVDVQTGYVNNFNLLLPIGGNYWSDYTGVDDDGDGIGDTPYTFTGGQDNYPFVVANGWSPPAMIERLIDNVIGLDLQHGIELSLDAKLDAAFNALDDVNQNNDVAAINSLNAFINAADAQRDKLEGHADELIAQAQAIIDIL